MEFGPNESEKNYDDWTIRDIYAHLSLATNRIFREGQCTIEVEDVADPRGGDAESIKILVGSKILRMSRSNGRVHIDGSSFQGHIRRSYTDGKKATEEVIREIFTIALDLYRVYYIECMA